MPRRSSPRPTRAPDLAAKPPEPPGATVGDLFFKLVEDGRTIAHAEVDFYREVARYRVAKARAGLAALGVAAVLANAAVIIAGVGALLGLSPTTGPLLAGLIVAAALALIAWLLLRYAMPRMSALGGDPAERAAVAEGEKRP